MYSLICFLLLQRSLAIDPNYAKNITIYHVNEHKFGAIPVNMDTGDAVGDMFFDMLEVIAYPLVCENGTKPSKFGPNPCENPEAGGKDLMVNKLTLEVDSRFSGYAACNVCLNGTDKFSGKPCETGTYFCDCYSHGFPPKAETCNSTVGYQELLETFGHYGSSCKRSLFNPHPTKGDCYTKHVIKKLSAANPGQWYSTLEKGYCGSNATGDCTWRVVSVNKIVKRDCHVQVFGAAVAATAPGCFENCGDQKANTSSPCWVDCFYQAALGPDSGKPGGVVAGMSTDALAAAWQKPFLSVEQGGCASQQEMSPLFGEGDAIVV